MQFDWWTLALQGVNFLLLVWLLERFLYRPVKDVIARRKVLAENAFAEANDAKSAAESERHRLSAEREKVADERQAMLARLHAEIEADRKAMVEKTAAEGEKLLSAAKAAIAEERKAVLKEMEKEISALATAMAATLLGRLRADVSQDVFLDQLKTRLAALSGEERERLARELARDGAGLTVVTATPLSAEEEARWRATLSDAFGASGRKEFVTDPAIIGGSELRFPHTRLRESWASKLETVQTGLTRDDVA